MFILYETNLNVLRFFLNMIVTPLCMSNTRYPNVNSYESLSLTLNCDLSL